MAEIKANKQNLKNLLERSETIIKHHNEITIAKGEHFNLFSVLGIESRENKTHSAFLIELLNPNGTHLQKDIFLKLFLQVIQREITKQEKNEKAAQKKLINNFINSTNTTVSPEISIGRRNDHNKEGGRIDIFIENRNNIICIENKIYAQDQNCQIERYCNYPKENTVLYLTLKVDSPSKQSSGNLKAGKDFYNISYKEHISDWLGLCLKEVPNLTSVRESINQYILLIKKLTHTMEIKEKQELQKVMAGYLEETAFIVENYEAMTTKLKSNFRKDVKKGLLEKLDSEIFTLKNGKSTHKSKSQLWVVFTSYPEAEVKFGLESFSGRGHIGGNLFVGIWNKDGVSLLVESIQEVNKINNWWKQTQRLYTEDGNEINLNHNYTLKILTNPSSEKYQKLVEEIVNQAVQFIMDYKNDVLSAIQNKKSLPLNIS
ncbi:PD-(D/E)XK nuclease superfamily protein [Salegentibacter holothuriorum]|uniref:PD-(D/E)XK nuclease superfamily protein n=1 Tax=Salegentibacter holothuriorum TaxID=241145 RepID=A0A1T5DZB9_9FLAO|nr:PD-(D/E)XK nuclease family protein [Salegentibacter holothuriorum]SKB76929.1 PD-(D/E)XK nuclease superfamily protein [Salegentibacter holothuriorum]